MTNPTASAIANSENDFLKQVETVLNELAGEASLCWNPRPTGVFDSTRALQAAQSAKVKLYVLLVGPDSPVCKKVAGSGGST